jgi:hypothetical protein
MWGNTFIPLVTTPALPDGSVVARLQMALLRPHLFKLNKVLSSPLSKQIVLNHGKYNRVVADCWLLFLRNTVALFRWFL